MSRTLALQLILKLHFSSQTHNIAALIIYCSIALGLTEQILNYHDLGLIIAHAEYFRIEEC